MTLLKREANLGDMLIVSAYLPAEERAQLEAFTGAPYEIDSNAVRAWRFPGPKWTAVDSSDPRRALVVGGFIPQRRGVYQTWFMATPEACQPGVGKELTEVVSATIKEQLSSAHRIETLCLASREQTRRWYERIGLHFETLLHGFGANGEDAAVHVALRKPEVVH